MFTTAHAAPIDLGYSEQEPLGDAYSLFWNAVNPLPAGSIVAAGWPDALAYWRKEAGPDFRFTLVQIDEPVIDEDDDSYSLVPGYVEQQDPNTLSCGGDIEVAFVVREGWGVQEAEQVLSDGIPDDEDAAEAFWARLEALPVGSLIATGFVDDGVVFYRRVEGPFHHGWVVEQVDNPATADCVAVGEKVGNDMLDANGGIEVAYIVTEA